MADPIKPSVDILDLEKWAESQAAIAKIMRFVQPMAKEGEFTPDQAAAASDAIKELGFAIKDAKEKKLEITKEWRDNTTYINNNFSELLDGPEAAYEALKDKAHKHNLKVKAEEDERLRQEQERADREAEKKAADAAEAAKLAADEGTAEAQELADEMRSEAATAAVAATPSPPRKQPTTIRGSNSALGGRTEWKFEVVDKDAVDEVHKVINKQSVTAMMRAEVAAAKAEDRPVKADAIAGIRIYDKSRPVSR